MVSGALELCVSSPSNIVIGYLQACEADSTSSRILRGLHAYDGLCRLMAFEYFPVDVEPPTLSLRPRRTAGRI